MFATVNFFGIAGAKKCAPFRRLLWLYGACLGSKQASPFATFWEGAAVTASQFVTLV